MYIKTEKHSERISPKKGRNKKRIERTMGIKTNNKNIKQRYKELMNELHINK
jgi:hypothetical protein